jgi:KDO2-lipid IV(A) lauroyltransferase
MKTIFKLLSLFPRDLLRSVLKLLLKLGIFKNTASYKLTNINLKLVFEEKSNQEITNLTEQSFIESVISLLETFHTWGSNIKKSNNQIFRVENNYLMNINNKKNNQLLIISFHNRSVDMLLRWINLQIKTATIYKKVKSNILENFVRKNREVGMSKMSQATMSGVRDLYKSAKRGMSVCMAVDQVPKRGLGEYVEFFGMPAYTTTLMPSLATKLNQRVIYANINLTKGDKISVKLTQSDESIYDKSKHLLSMNKTIKSIILENIKDYSWEYKRFRRPPEGCEDPYKL